MEKLQNILLHHEFAGQIRMLAMEERGMLLTAIYDYELGDPFDEDDLPFAVRLVFIRIRDYLDRNRALYAERCARNAENGKKGGRPKKSKATDANTGSDTAEEPEKSERFSEEPQKAKHKNKSKNKDKNKNISHPPEEECARAKEQPTAPIHPHLCDQERSELLEKGISEEYIDSRLSRAAEHAGQSGQPIGEILIAWWSSDRHTPPWNRQVGSASKPDKRAVGALGRSFDADEFFQAALNRTFRTFGILSSENPPKPLPSPS